ncbi:MAG: adenosylmethionine--8-amino-7-oxononanoate transaminase [Verrucomicrobia bacterium]|nr:adenosylmethionine--8-amino-7-oxononanoate transaminase [Verrucomicrobiota bacterium]
MKDWLQQEPIVLASGRGAVLKDVQGRAYLDANSSIWTNLHGHNHPHLNRALRQQLKRVAHTSALGFANPPASLLAAQLALLTRSGKAVGPELVRSFFSDDGSTALEVALKLAYEFTRRTRGARPAPRFLSLEGAYHGDTIGAVSLGHSPLFHRSFSGLLFKSDSVMAPYCYRCPFNRASPERADARTYRSCHWECVGQMEAKLETARRQKRPYSAFAFEPRIQGAAGMIPQPEGWLARTSALAREHGALLIADEVMTGFGRTGGNTLFAALEEGVRPDLLCLAKGLAGGYLPLAVTLTSPTIFDAFLGEYAEFKTFFHGHSFTANPLAAATALASLELLTPREARWERKRLERQLASELTHLWSLPSVGDIRQVGLVVGVELVRDWTTREPFALAERAGIRVCEAMAKRGVLTRPIGNVVVLMPPYCTTPSQLTRIVRSLHDAVVETLGSPRLSN